MNFAQLIVLHNYIDVRILDLEARIRANRVHLQLHSTQLTKSSQKYEGVKKQLTLMSKGKQQVKD